MNSNESLAPERSLIVFFSLCINDVISVYISRESRSSSSRDESDTYVYICSRPTAVIALSTLARDVYIFSAQEIILGVEFRVRDTYYRAGSRPQPCVDDKPA